MTWYIEPDMARTLPSAENQDKSPIASGMYTVGCPNQTTLANLRRASSDTMLEDATSYIHCYKEICPKFYFHIPKSNFGSEINVEILYH